MSASAEPGAAGPATTERPRTTFQRVAETVVWIFGVVTVLILGRIFVLLDTTADLSVFERGEVVGRIAGALFMGWVIRWAWVRIRKRGRVISPWILVIAALALTSQLARAGA
jgi:hypothetical protein